MTNLFLQSGSGQSGLPMFIMMVAIFAIMWLFMVRSQKKQKKIREFQNALKEGDKVVTGGGVYGTVKRVNAQENTIDIEVARGVVITVAKGYVFADATSQTPNA